MKYFIERQTPNGAWVSEGGCGPGFEFDSAVFFMTKKHHFWSEDVFRVIDETGAVVPHTASAEGKGESEVKEGTSTVAYMTYIVQWQDKDGKWYLEEEFQSVFAAFDCMRKSDARDAVPTFRRIISDDDKIEGYGCHLPAAPPPGPKKKPFWITLQDIPQKRFNSLDQAIMDTRHAPDPTKPRYVLQAVRVIDWHMEEMGE